MGLPSTRLEFLKITYNSVLLKERQFVKFVAKCNINVLLMQL